MFPSSATSTLLHYSPPLFFLHPLSKTKMNNTNFTTTINYQFLTSIKTLAPHITCLAVHRNLLYAASLNLINVYDLTNYTQGQPDKSKDLVQVFTLHNQWVGPTYTQSQPDKLKGPVQVSSLHTQWTGPTYTHIDTFNQTSTSGFVKSIAFNNSTVFTAHQDCKIRVWLITPAKRHRLISSLPTVKDRLHRCIIPRNYVKVRRHRKKLWIQHSDTVSGLAVNEKFMYSVSWDKCLKIWDLDSGNYYRCLESFDAHDDAINAVVVSDNGDVYTAAADGCIKVWKMDDKVKRYVLVSTVTTRKIAITQGKQKRAVNALALNVDGTELFSGESDGTICRWGRGEKDVVGLMEMLRGHSGAILCMVKVGDLLVSGSGDLTVRIWLRERGDGGGYCCRGVLEGHEKPVKSLVGVEEDGVVKLFSGSLDGEIRVWEVFGLC